MVSISIDASLLVQLANFLVLMFILNIFLYKPIKKILAERKALFADLKDKAAKAKSALDNGEAEKARLSAESLRLGMDKRAAVKAEGQAREKEILAEAQGRAAKELEEARAKIKTESEAARAGLAEETRVIAWEMAGKVLGRTL